MRATHVEWRGKLKVGRIVAHIRARRRSWKTRVQFSTVKSTWRRRRGRPEVNVGHFGENSAYFCIKCCGPVPLPSPSPPPPVPLPRRAALLYDKAASVARLLRDSTRKRCAFRPSSLFLPLPPIDRPTDHRGDASSLLLLFAVIKSRHEPPPSRSPFPKHCEGERRIKSHR